MTKILAGRRGMKEAFPELKMPQKGCVLEA